MEAFKVDPKTGDIVLDAQNNIVIIDGDDEIIQCVERVLTTNLGEWFLDLDEGLEKSAILGVKRFNPSHAKEVIVTAILQEPRIARVESVELQHDPGERTLDAYVVLIKANGERLEATFNVN